MTRESIFIDIPEIYVQNDKLGVCRVCGKPKEQFEKGRRKYCSSDCFWKYQDCFKTWNHLRGIILSKYPKCVKCNSDSKLEVDHIKAIMNGGNMWDDNNLQTLCHKCHVKKTRQDFYELKYVKDNQTKLTFMED